MKMWKSVTACVRTYLDNQLCSKSKFTLTMESDCSHEIKDISPWEKSYAQPRQQTKGRGISLSAKVCRVKATAFPVVMHGCESWTIKKAECERTDSFEL